MHLKAKKIILGVSGSIAAYKAAFLTRLLIKSGAEVQVLMTSSATEFITPLTLSTLSKRPVFSDISSEESWNNHVELGLWADAMLIAPATATTLAKLAHGICDNILVATYLSARCPVLFAPAMDLDMWKHPSNQDNIKRLISFGNHLIPVEHGELASGLVGKGRMAEPEHIVQFLDRFFSKEQDLIGKTALVTAGPTYEAIDPIRFIGNRSTGKMGLAIAEELAARGAKVNLVLGPSSLSSDHRSITVQRVESAEEMYKAATGIFEKVDIAVLSAAVADFRPKTVSSSKIKKKNQAGQGEGLKLDLVRTKDIAASLGQSKRRNQIIVGFALETNDEIENAKGKLEKKNFDFIVLNSLQDKGAGFAHDTNKITILSKDNKMLHFKLKKKKEVAIDIVNEIVNLIKK